MGAGIGRGLVEADAVDEAVRVRGERTPRLTELASPASATAGVDTPRMEHGQAGAVAWGVAGLEGEEAGPVPTELVAVTVKV